MSDSALSAVLSKMRASERRAGRAEGEVKLVAVSKQQPDERVDAVLAEGHRCFGENRVQEAQTRWSDRRAVYADLELRLIGPLQTNKVNAALELFDAIESVDRPKLAQKLADAVQAKGAAPELFIQVNTGEEPQKAGIAPQELDGFLKDCRVMELPIAGLMAIPPASEPVEPHFGLLYTLAERNGLVQLSMGMSADYETAIALGATSVRVGSGVFGARQKPA